MPRRRQRVRYEQVSEFERGRIVGLRETGLSYRAIAARVGREASTVVRVWRQWQEEGTTSRRPGSGARRQTTAREDRLLVRMALADRTATSRVLAQQWGAVTRHPLSASAIRHRLLQEGLAARHPLLRLPLTPAHRRRRLEWCQERRNWDQEWNHIVFSDESRFNLMSHDGRVFIRRRQGERHQAACIVLRHTAPQRGVMVWGAISYDARSRLLHIRGTLTGQRYRTEIVEAEVVPFLRRLPGATFQQDNARPHVAQNVLESLATHAIPVLPWPARSPDLSPIEHVWDMIGRRLTRLPQPPATEDDLWRGIQAAWADIPQATIQTLIRSMPRRIEAVLRARGGYTRY